MLAKRRLPTLPTDLDADISSSVHRLDDHPVHDEGAPLAGGPYRDASDAKLARKRELERWLRTLDDAEAMRASFERERAMLDAAVREERRELLSRVELKTSCRERWEDMPGSDAQRRCARCRRDVFDLSQLTRSEVEALFAREEQSPCVRLRKRRDGRVVTGDCPPESHFYRKVGELALCTLASAAVSGVAFTAARSFDERVERLEERSLESERRLEAQSVPALAASSVPSEAAETPALEEGALEEVMMGESTLAPRDETEPDGGLEISRVRAHEYVVSRSFLERTLTGTSTVRRARVLPYEREGIVLGVRLFGVRRDDVLGQLGVQNGDVLLRINGLSVATPDTALQAYSALRGSTHFDVALLRRGRPVTLRYTVLG